MAETVNVTREDLQKWLRRGISMLTVSHLKRLLEQYDERRSGRKADMIQRLEAVQSRFTTDVDFMELHDRILRLGVSLTPVTESTYVPRHLESRTQSVRYASSPFHIPQHTVCDPITLERSYANNKYDIRRKITLSDEDLNKLANGQYGIFIMGSKASVTHSDKERLVDFPKSMLINIDGEFIQWTRKTKPHVYGMDPINITPIILRNISRNRHHHSINVKIDMEREMTEYYISVHMTELIPVSVVLEHTKITGPHIPKEQEIMRIKRENEPEGDDDLVATSATVSLKDPISLSRIKQAAKSLTCTHTECFDLETFFVFQHQSATWVCPLCNNKMRYANIALDDYMQEILDKAKDSDIEEVEIGADGVWKLPISGGSKKRSGESDEKESPPMKRHAAMQPTDFTEIIDLDTEEDEATDGGEEQLPSRTDQTRGPIRNENETFSTAGNEHRQQNGVQNGNLFQYIAEARNGNAAVQGGTALAWSPSWEQSLLFGGPSNEGGSSDNGVANPGLQLPGGGVLKPGLNIMNNESASNNQSEPEARSSRLRVETNSNPMARSNLLNDADGSNESIMTPDSNDLLSRAEAETLLREAERMSSSGSRVPTITTTIATPVTPSMPTIASLTRDSIFDLRSGPISSNGSPNTPTAHQETETLNSGYQTQDPTPSRKFASENIPRNNVDPALENIQSRMPLSQPTGQWPMMSNNFRPREIPLLPPPVPYSRGRFSLHRQEPEVIDLTFSDDED